MEKDIKISRATLQRYPIYLKALTKIKSLGITRILSSQLGEYVSIKPTTIRRDLSLIGNLGKQGYGYDVDALIEIFQGQLGNNYDEKIILIGCGNFGKALLNYNKWNDVVGEIVCAFDKNADNIKASVPVYNIKDIDKYMPKNCHIALLCISDDVDDTVKLLADNGITGIVDFTREHFTTPKGVTVKSVDLVSSIQELVFIANNI